MSSELVARTGRHQQRYEGGCRLIAGCIPYRYRKCVGNDMEKVIEVLMINSTSGPGLLFPKGGWENDETDLEAAVREAIEEAGVRGILQRQEMNKAAIVIAAPLSIGLIMKDKIGEYHFKSKTLQDECCPEGLCKASMFALLVEEELEFWPEQDTRTRSWLTIDEAFDSCRHKWMESALTDWNNKMFSCPD